MTCGRMMILFFRGGAHITKQQDITEINGLRYANYTFDFSTLYICMCAASYWAKLQKLSIQGKRGRTLSNIFVFVFYFLLSTLKQNGWQSI
jgi:hypothetical protein